MHRLACSLLLGLAACDNTSSPPTPPPPDPVPHSEPQVTPSATEPTPPARRPAASLVDRVMECPDGLGGVWYAKGFFENVVWREVKLTIVEDGDTLRGSIFSRGWDGGAADGKPGVLADGTFDGFMITETAIGRTDGKRVNFRALTIDKREGSQEYLDRGYALDHFTGVIDGDRHEIRAFNNDGKYAFDREYTFRRISCK